MGFILDGLDTDSYDREYGDLELVRRILGYFRARARDMSIAGGSILGNAMMNAVVPLIISRGIDIAVADPDAGRLLWIGAIALAAQSLGWLLNYLRQRHSARAIGDVVLALRRDVFGAVVEQDLSFFDDQPSGKIVSRVTSDTRDFATTADLTMNLVSQVLSVGIIAGIALNINVKLTLLMIALTPVVFVIALSFRRIARKSTRNARRVRAQVNANIQESVSGIAVAKSFRQEQAMYEEFAGLNQQAYRIGLVRGITMVSIFPALGATFGIAVALVLYQGGATVLQGLLAGGAPGGLTIGQWYLFMQAMGYFWFPMTSVASFWSQFQDGLSAAERVFALIDAEPRVLQNDCRKAPRLRGEVAFRGVSLAYTEDEVVLPEFSLEIASGEKVALVGHTGAGKTSVARLLARLYEFQQGQILVDGKDIRSFNLGEYRRQLGVVPQAPFLFTGTVCDNIRYGRPEATVQAAHAAAQQVGGGEWLGDLADGLDTDVGERGARLSMGQRQLVALTRVLLQDPAILILDEATASVDPFTEALIQEGLKAVMKGRTSIIIAHRLSTVTYADRIIVMREGRIIEEGSHEALLSRGGHYAELYNTYFRHQSLEYVEESRGLFEG